MGTHDSYGKELLKEIYGNRFVTTGDVVKVLYAGGISAQIDGVIRDCCAIEIESRTDKQIRGAIVDLLNHRLKKKLLIIIPAHMPRPRATVEHCIGILNAMKKPDDIAHVVLLEGTGKNPHGEIDRMIIESELREMSLI